MTLPEFTPDEQAALLEAATRDAATPLSDAGLAVLIAQTEAIRRDLWNHDQRTRADYVWQQLVTLQDVQAERRQLAEAVEDALNPYVELDVGDD